MKKLGGYFVLRKQGLTEKLRGKCLEVSGNLRNFAFDGSNDRAPAFFEADTHYHLHARKSDVDNIGVCGNRTLQIRIIQCLNDGTNGEQQYSCECNDASVFGGG